MSAANRSGSPITQRHYKQLVVHKEKIHRIRLATEALCKLVGIVSPDCLWFRPTNHISDQLQYVKPSPLNRLEFKEGTSTQRVELYDYVMAPLCEDIYVRGRVIRLHRYAATASGSEHAEEDVSAGKYGGDDDYALIHFIDEASRAWMRVACLAKMSADLYAYPWQAMPIALFRVKPGISLVDSLQPANEWSNAATEALKRICAEYEFFRVVPAFDSRRVNSYHEYIRAEVFGHTSAEDEIGESINHRLAFEMARAVDEATHVLRHNGLTLQRSLFDASEHALIEESADAIEPSIIPGAEIPKWRQQFPTQFDDDAEPKEADDVLNERQGVLDEDSESRLAEEMRQWNSGCKMGICSSIPSLTHKYMRKNGYFCTADKCHMICIDWKSVKSPYEFYAFPLKIDGDEGGDDGNTRSQNPIMRLYEEQLNWSSVINSFYSRSENRKSIGAKLIKDTLANKQRVFVICEISTEGSNGSYRRAQVLAIRNPMAADCDAEFCRIRFLDTGGNDIVPLASLLAIHSSHCASPPMCLQLSLVSIIPPNCERDWPQRSCRMFKRLARSDVPLVCKFTKKISSSVRGLYDGVSWLWPDVMEVRDLRPDTKSGDGATIEQQMIDHGGAVPAPVEGMRDSGEGDS